MKGHPSLTEPVLSHHLRTEHHWSTLRVWTHTYFERLVAHRREHGRARAVTS